MPYKVVKSDNKYCVEKESGGRVGCHDDRASALRQMRAVYANEGKSAGNKDDEVNSSSANNVPVVHEIPPTSVANQPRPTAYEEAQQLHAAVQQLDAQIEVDRTPDGVPIMKWLSELNGAGPRLAQQPATAPTPTPTQPLVAQQASYVGGYDVETHQLSHGEVGYNPVGGDNERACANCQWFVSPDSCILVRGDISPTGVSNLWRAEEAYEPNPIPVRIVADVAEQKEPAEPARIVESSRYIPLQHNTILDKATSFVSNILGKGEPNATPPLTLFKVKSVDEQGVVSEGLRFVAYWTNQFQDRGGECIPEIAHQRMIEWCDSMGKYPPLVSWHALGTEYGQVDCIDYNDGFVVAFGSITPGREDIAYKVAGQKDIGMSHGSLYRTDSITGEIIQYYPFEISDLPRARAKNSWTSWALADLEKEMAFNEEKKKYLASVGHTPEQITAAEASTSAFAAQLKELGIAFKDDEPPDTAALMQTISDLSGKLVEANTAITDLTTKYDAMVPQVEAANKSLDEAVAAAIAPRGAAAQQIHAASKSGENTEPTPVGAAAGAATNTWDAKAFNAKVFGGMRKPSEA